MTLLLAQVDGVAETPEAFCYRTGVLGRFVCPGRWPNDRDKWCDGCARRDG